MKTKFVNLTDHTYLVNTDEGEVIKITPSGVIPRIKCDRDEGTLINGVPVYNTRIKRVDNLPPPKIGVKYIVFPPIKRVARDLLNRSDCISAIKAQEVNPGIIKCEGFTS